MKCGTCVHPKALIDLVKMKSNELLGVARRVCIGGEHFGRQFVCVRQRG